MYIIILRILHILAGVFWVGAAMLFFFFVQPTAKALGPQAGPFMGHLTEKRKMPTAIIAASGLTVVAGVLLYWEVSGGFSAAWVTSGMGIGFTVGAVAAIIAFAVGLVVVKPTVTRVGALTAEVQASGGPPSEAQASELQRLGGRLSTVGMANMALLTVAVVAMATARYL